MLDASPGRFMLREVEPPLFGKLGDCLVSLRDLCQKLLRLLFGQPRGNSTCLLGALAPIAGDGGSASSGWLAPMPQSVGEPASRGMSGDQNGDGFARFISFECLAKLAPRIRARDPALRRAAAGDRAESAAVIVKTQQRASERAY